MTTPTESPAVLEALGHIKEAEEAIAGRGGRPDFVLDLLRGVLQGSGGSESKRWAADRLKEYLARDGQSGKVCASIGGGLVHEQGIFGRVREELADLASAASRADALGQVDAWMREFLTGELTEADVRRLGIGRCLNVVTTANRRLETAARARAAAAKPGPKAAGRVAAPSLAKLAAQINTRDHI